MSEATRHNGLALEVGDGNFADERLNKRLRQIVVSLAEDPSKSLPCLLDDAGLEAAYRFFSNFQVTSDDILRPHIEATRARCESAGDVLVLHDTTDFSYRWGGERQGLGRIVRSKPQSGQRFFGHFSLAVAADGTRRPLGVAGLKTWTRGPEPTGTEYQRWEDQIKATSEQLNAHKTAIHLMDREADDYQMFHALVEDKHRFVARCLNNRWLETPTGNVKLRTLLEQTPSTIEREVPLVRRKPKQLAIQAKIHPPRSERTAKLSIAATEVALKRPKTRRKHVTETGPTLTINVVRVWEASPPEGEAAVEWYLYTTEPIETPEQQLAIVDYYRARWTIEEYFKALKTGCAFEARQLQDYESLVNLLATFAPIAYHLLLLRSEARRAPDESAITVLSKDHIDVLRVKGRMKLSATPTTQEVYFAIAVLGGHIRYKPNPGWLTLARGFEKLSTLTEGWTAAKLQLHSDQP
ncbi:MAG: IS4 family transposase [Polyangiaceae bacterium]|nr:IS4 family transposase [Polyangiaceae bacterium]